MDTDSILVYRTFARHWRRNARLPESGFVIFFDGEPVGWIADLESSRAWVGDCVAVPADDSALYHAPKRALLSNPFDWIPVNSNPFDWIPVK